MRIIQVQTLKEARAELLKLGCDPSGVRIMSPKAIFKIIKLRKVRSIAANIIKQEMLSFGGEAATSYGSLDLSDKTTDLLIMGTQKQLKLLTKKLKMHQFGLSDIARTIENGMKHYDHAPEPITIKGKKMIFGKKTYIMGVLNVTPDSFSDGGKFLDVKKAVAQAEQMIEDGADIIDIGGESTRPGAKPVPEDVEKQRVIPVIERLRSKNTIISIDTRKASVAEAAIKAGASIINDVSGFNYDKNTAKIAARHGVPVVLMHTSGTPEIMQKRTRYSDLMGDVIDSLNQSLKIAEAAGIARKNVILDPGFGFGKTPEQNLEMLSRLRELRSMGQPLLIGTSRKSTIGHILGLPSDRRIEGTSSTIAIAISAGVDIIRVHDVKEMKNAAKMADAIVRRA